jgi:hypothetical protein
MLLPISFLLSFLNNEILSVILDICGWFATFFGVDYNLSNGLRSILDLSVSPASIPERLP